MSITTTGNVLLPIRRDGQIGGSGINISGGGSSSMGGGGGITAHSALSQLDYASSGHTGFLASADGIAYDSYRLGGALANTYAPLASPTFTGDVKYNQNDSWIQLNRTATTNYLGIVNSTNEVDKWYQGLREISPFDDSYHFYNFTNDIDVLILLENGHVSIPRSLHIGGTSDPGADNLLVDGTIKGESLESVTAFSSGFTGNGYKVIETGGISSLEVDQLTVRGLLKVYELQINKISSVNGGMIISVANAKCIDVIGTALYFDEGIGLAIPFVVDDYIKAQQFTGTGVATYLGKIIAVNAGNVIATTISGAPWIGMDLVQLGNSNTATYSARQSAIYLTAADTNNPYIAGYAGITDGLFAGHEKFRLGNLTGITDALIPSISGFGLYAQNAFLTGKLVLPSAGMTDEGALSTSVRIYAGDTYANRAIAPFRVTQAGALTALGVAEIGTSVDGFGYNVAIKGSNIWENLYNGDNSYIGINLLSYNGGGTKTRQTIIGNGKGLSSYLASFADDGIVFLKWTSINSLSIGEYIGGVTVDPGLNNLSVAGNITAAGLHIGGDSDPGNDNLLVDGTTKVIGAFGCNNTTPQTPYVSALSLSYTSGTYGLNTLTQLNNLMNTVAAIRTALVNNGIMSY